MFHSLQGLASFASIVLFVSLVHSQSFFFFFSSFLRISIYIQNICMGYLHDTGSTSLIKSRLILKSF